MTEKVIEILRILDERYPFENKCFLNYETPWQLLVATILSAQCTDERVNMVTPALFERFPSVEALAGADHADVERAVKSTGFYRSKAKNIISAMQTLLTRYGGEMPSGIDELTGLAGVGRKTANVVRGYIFGIPCVVVDTHVKRVSRRLGLTENNDPVKIEFDLMAVLPREHWVRYNHQIIAHGRAVCKAPNARCGECFMTHVCGFYGK